LFCVENVKEIRALAKIEWSILRRTALNNSRWAHKNPKIATFA